MENGSEGNVMNFLRDNKTFLALLIPFLLTPWIKIGKFHLLLFNFSHNRLEIGGFGIEMETYALIALVLLLGIGIALISALTLSRFYCGTLCPNTFFAHLLSLVTKKKSSWIRKLFGFILLVFLSFMLAFSLVAYGVESAELSYALAHLTFSGWLVIFLSLLMAAEVFMIQGWYCAYLCPYGAICAILPIEDRLSYEFSDPASDCTECKGCVKVCPIPALDIRKGFDIRCIQCGLCETVCEKSFTKNPDIATLITHDNRSVFHAAGKGYGYLLAVILILAITLFGTFHLLQEERLESCRLENKDLYKININ